MMIKKNDIELWSNLTFKTTSYVKNYDFIDPSDSFVNEYMGQIIHTRFSDKLPPFIVGEYTYSILNLDLAIKFKINLFDLIERYSDMDNYNEVFKCLTNNEISIENTNKLLIVNNLIIHDSYKKCGISEEFTEFLYRTQYGSQNRIFALVKPLQENKMDFEYYLKENSVKFRETNDFGSAQRIMSGSKYYNIGGLLKKDDVEINKYKIFSVASKCGFKRIGESYLFEFNPEKIHQRILNKFNIN